MRRGNRAAVSTLLYVRVPRRLPGPERAGRAYAWAGEPYGRQRRVRRRGRRRRPWGRRRHAGGVLACARRRRRRRVR